MELRELFYKKLKNKLDEQVILQESLEGFVKKYTPVLERLVNEYPNFYFGKEINGSGNMTTIDEKTVPRIIERIHSLDPTSKEQFAKAIMNIFLNTLIHDLVQAKKSDDYKIEIIDYIRETEGSVKRYFSAIKYLKNNFNYSQKIKNLNEFKMFTELNGYNKKLTDIGRELELKKDSKGFNKMEFIAETKEWEARACWDEDQMVNTFGGWSDWCIAKRRGWWEQYTGQEFLTQENARPGIPIVFKNKTSTKNHNDQSIKFICVILAYDDEGFWEFRNRKDVNIYDDGSPDEKKVGEQIFKMENDVVDNLKRKYKLETIWEIGEEKFNYLDGSYKDAEEKYSTTYNGTEYPNEDIEEVFGNIPKELENENWTVDEIIVDSDIKNRLFYNFLSEINAISYEKTIEVNGYVFFDHSDTSPNEYNLKLKINNPRSIISIGDLVESLDIIDTENFKEIYSSRGYKEIELNNTNVSLITIDSDDGEQLFIDNFYADTFKIWGNKDIIINNGKINAMIIDEFGGEITLQGSSAIELINYEYGNKFQILDCPKYNIFSNEKEITFVLSDSNNIKKNKEQYIKTKYDYKSIIFEIDADQSGLVFTIDGGNKSLREIALPDVTGVTFKMTKEMFDNLETIEGDENQIEIID